MPLRSPSSPALLPRDFSKGRCRHDPPDAAPPPPASPDDLRKLTRVAAAVPAELLRPLSPPTAADDDGWWHRDHVAMTARGGRDDERHLSPVPQSSPPLPSSPPSLSPPPSSPSSSSPSSSSSSSSPPPPQSSSPPPPPPTIPNEGTYLSGGWRGRAQARRILPPSRESRTFRIPRLQWKGGGGGRGVEGGGGGVGGGGRRRHRHKLKGFRNDDPKEKGMSIWPSAAAAAAATAATAARSSSTSSSSSSSPGPSPSGRGPKGRGLMMLTLILLVALTRRTQAGNPDKNKMVKIDGDVIFGGMFPMHERGLDEPCGSIKEEKGIQRMEAMLYALDKINRDTVLLPNITIGALILDTCSSDTYALEQSMEFFRSSLSQDASDFKCKGGKKPIYNPPKPVIGVIGAASSSVSVMIANILRLFKIPQISYASTSTELSDKSRFEYFSRVVPPDNFQAMAMVEMVRALDWQYVSTLADEGDYGEKGIASFSKLAQQFGICIAVVERIQRITKPEDFDHIIDRLSTKPQARVVIMFVDEDNTRRVLAAAVKAGKTGHFLWVGSDSWGAKIHPVRDQEEAALGAITILPQKKTLKGFDEYFLSLRPKKRGTICGSPNDIDGGVRNCRNVWFKEFWTQHFNCTFRDPLPPGRRGCTGTETITHEQEGLVPFVVDAVYAMAHAFHNLLLEKCNELVLCDGVLPAPSGQDMLYSIRNVSFIGQQGREVKFNTDGDAPGSYFIYQYQKVSQNSYDYVLIGSWTESATRGHPMRHEAHRQQHRRSSLQLNTSRLEWSGYRGNESIPMSICSSQCPTGFIRNYQDSCCWSCVPCPEDSIIYNDTCRPCDLGWAPTSDKVSCFKLAPEHITWDSAWAIVPLAFSSLGLLFTLLTTITFIRYNTTPVIMASGRELCYVLLAGIALCYLMTFVILAPPSTSTCALLRIGLGTGLCICYSAIFTKTNRISRIFNRGMKSIKRPSYTSPRSQIVICMGLVGVQLVGVVAWMLVEFPTTKEVYPYRLVAVLTCGISNISLILSLAYNMVLILLCTVYAFKTRKIPENFNEAKYIGFTMYSTCIVWLAFVPIYFGTNNDYKIQLASMCMCVSISASVSLGCLFTPKVYIVIFQPYKNVRQGSGPVVKGSQCKSMRFTSRSQTAQSVLSTNHSSIPAPPPSTISQHVNGDSLTVTTPSVDESSIT
ncbi:metabotropic glutamate receptor 8-like isoform X2 [Macrobrachium nipponense]|uniref:metabotropic glutamate receptor 8-like isoform X2 n=1 Tax=Macrobrachium nipponense TaxID=159736 RepID=UPI0030C870C3